MDSGAMSQPEVQDGFYHVLLPCMHETPIEAARAQLGMALPNVTCAECQAGPFTVVPVSNDELRQIGSYGPYSPTGMTFLVPPAGALEGDA
jgi:hypothetical protein